MCFNVGIYDVKQRQINNVYSSVDVNIRQRRNNVVLLNVEFHNVGQRRKNVVEMTVFKKNQKSYHFKFNTLNSKF